IIRFAIAIPIFTFAFVTGWLFDSTKTIQWFGIPFSPLAISFFFVSFYTVWAVIGLYRGLRSELQYVTGSAGWIGFLLSAIVFNAGLMTNIQELNVFEIIITMLASAFLFYLIIVYYMALQEAKDVVNLRLVLNTLKAKNLKKLGEISPLWLITLPLAFTAGILALLFLLVYTPSQSMDPSVMEFKNLDKTTLIALLLSVFGFVIRDLALMLWINFNTSARRADIASWVYLIFIYYLLPSVSGGKQVGFMFYPDPSSNPILLIAVPLLEAVLAVYILKNKWTVINEKLV
ncbi:MAG: hypothetical protein K2Q22_04135, partial [Cytophagales bacterium]|nr:hypothetical protein [Cytophagales bacterium]